ncbi:MAG: MarC family protein [Campylobacterales bacterium]|nr:MarC family protein [Campylobacterales bacterium]NQY52782.1 MarC family protein [Campylobacteraceae bacterium]
MNIFLDSLLQNTITFFAILDPIGVSALVLSLLPAAITPTQMNDVARKSTFTIIIAFFVVLISGDFVLKVFAINQNSVKVMGGLVLILMALQMVRGSMKSKKPTKAEEIDVKDHDDLSVIPIAIPITFGPGIFTTIIIYKQEAHTFMDISSLILAFLINAFLIYITFRYSVYIKKFLGITGQNIVTKVMGLIVGAIAVQFIISGAVELIKVYM